MFISVLTSISIGSVPVMDSGIINEWMNEWMNEQTDPAYFSIAYISVQNTFLLSFLSLFLQ